MNKKYFKENILIVTCGLIMFFLISNLKYVSHVIDNLIEIILPVIFGCVLAFFLNMPMSFLEKKIRILLKKFNLNEKKVFTISRAMSLVIVFLTLIIGGILVINVVIPEILHSLYTFIEKAPEQIKNIEKFLTQNSNNNYILETIFSKFNKVDKNIMNIVSNILKTSFSGILNITLGITNVLINLILGLVISVYILLEKESLKFQIKTIICKFMKDKHKRYVIETIKLTYSKFKKYIFGQTIDSFILSIMIFVSMAILNIPYGLFISLILGLCAAVPILGPFIGVIITTIIMIIAGYKNILLFIFIVVLMQQIEGNIIYPIVVGNSIGLSSLYIVLIVIVFSSLFGILGVIVGVPLCGACYELICNYIRQKDVVN